MGAASARRRENERMDAEGIARPRDPWCPSCGSRRLVLMGRERFKEALDVPEAVRPDSDWQGCVDCKAVWEAYPVVYARDPVCAEPCDNCAFRPGSPEQRDPKRWRELMDQLKLPLDAPGRGQFFCHKGIPIDMDKGPGNFLFPKRRVTMDGQLLRNGDGSEVLTADTTRMRTCSGYLRMTWALNDKRADAGDGA